MKSPVQMATYATTAHKAAHMACATEPSNRTGRTEAAIVPTAAAPQPKATRRAKGALARRAARRASRIHSRSINEPPRPDIDPLPRHPATPGLTALEILTRGPASHGRNPEPGLRRPESLPIPSRDAEPNNTLSSTIDPLSLFPPGDCVAWRNREREKDVR